MIRSLEDVGFVVYLFNSEMQLGLIEGTEVKGNVNHKREDNRDSRWFCAASVFVAYTSPPPPQVWVINAHYRGIHNVRKKI